MNRSFYLVLFNLTNHFSVQPYLSGLRKCLRFQELTKVSLRGIQPIPASTSKVALSRFSVSDLLERGCSAFQQFQSVKKLSYLQKNFKNKFELMVFEHIVGCMLKYSLRVVEYRSMFYWQFVFMYIFSVSLKIGICYISWWGESRVNNVVVFH